MLKIFKKKENDSYDEDLFRSLKSDGIPISREYIKKARNNDGETLFAIGSHYYTSKNYPKAFIWLLKAAVQNHSKAQTFIGLLYHNGQGVPQDYQQAMDWYLKAANNGHSYAQCDVGIMYYHGYGVQTDYKKAMEWWVKSVNNDGNSTAQNWIGELYRIGQGVPKHIPTAIEWYTKAENKGDKSVCYPQYNFGLICEEEEDYKDLQKAVNWYQKSADNGLEEAKAELKRLNEQGYYPSYDYKNVEKPQIISKPHSNRIEDQQQQQQVPLTSQNDEHVNKLIEEKMKILEEAFQLRLNFLQQDKIEKDTLQKSLENLKQEHAKTENQQREKDEEIRQLKEALAKYQAGSVGNPDNDICYDSSIEESDHENDINYDTECGDDDSEEEEDDDDDDDEEKKKEKKKGKKKADDVDDRQNDINYDSSSSDDDDSMNDLNYLFPR